MSKDVLVAKATTDNRALGLPDGCFDQMEGLIDRSAQLGGFDWSWEMKFATEKGPTVWVKAAAISVQLRSSTD
jgi:hypothetical protein